MNINIIRMLTKQSRKYLFLFIIRKMYIKIVKNL